jgi:hypothetical protein
MIRATATNGRMTLWPIVAAALALHGCSMGSTQRETRTETVVRTIDSSVTIYLQTMNNLGNADAAKQADVFYEVEREYTRAPTTASSLRYAVALVTTGHPASNPVAGKKMLEALLATPERMTTEERVLAAVLLQGTEARLKLEAENRRLLETVDGRNRSQANSEKRAQQLLEENARLRRALDEAQQKLNAIKEIERSISERSPTPSGSNRDATPSETQSPPASR